MSRISLHWKWDWPRWPIRSFVNLFYINDLHNMAMFFTCEPFLLEGNLGIISVNFFLKFPLCLCVLLSHVRLFATPWTIAHQTPVSMGFSGQEYWSGLPSHSPGDLRNPGIKSKSPAWRADSFLCVWWELLGFVLLKISCINYSSVFVFLAYYLICQYCIS